MSTQAENRIRKMIENVNMEIEDLERSIARNARQLADRLTALAESFSHDLRPEHKPVGSNGIDIDEACTRLNYLYNERMQLTRVVEAFDANKAPVEEAPKSNAEVAAQAILDAHFQAGDIQDLADINHYADEYPGLTRQERDQVYNILAKKLDYQS